jgi:hypothetical protein
MGSEYLGYQAGAPPKTDSPAFTGISASTETDVLDWVNDFLSAPSTFGPGIYWIVNISSGHAFEHVTSEENNVISEFLEQILRFGIIFKTP